MNAARHLATSALVLLSTLPILEVAAAPGRLTPTGPFAAMDFGVERLVFPTSDPKRLLILTRSDLFESRDAGASWRSVIANGPRMAPDELVVDSVDPDRWYLVDAQMEGARIWATADAGRSWNALPLPAEFQDPGEWRSLTLFLDARDPRTLALEAYSASDPDLRRRHYFSRDRGLTWTGLPPAARFPHEDSLLGVNGGKVFFRNGRYDIASGVETRIASCLYQSDRLVFDRTRADTLFTIFRSKAVAKSTDLGATCKILHVSATTIHFLEQSPFDPSHLASYAGGAGVALSLDRGETWIPQPGLWALDVAFDPASGELLLAQSDLRRRRLDGSLSDPLPIAGLDASVIRGIVAGGDRAMAVGYSGSSFFRGAEGVWERRGDVQDPERGITCVGGLVAGWFSQNFPGQVTAVCEIGVFSSSDGGWTWSVATSFVGGGTGPLQLASSGSTLYYLWTGRIFRSLDFGSTWEFLAGSDFSGIAVHPVRGLLAVRTDGSFVRYLPGSGLQPESAVLAGNVTQAPFPPHLVHDPAHPNLIYGIRGSLLSRSLDFGSSWELVADLDDALPFSRWDQWFFYSHLKTIIDPFDADHWMILGMGLETHDGGRSFAYVEDIAYATAAFDPLTPGRLLVAGDASNGVRERTAALAACPETGNAWCAREGRFLVTVDWKDPQRQQGRGTPVATGSEDSGLFYFFDAGNWELLVKVLDGCAINQRHWLFAAGTTDVEYTLRVEDRWTGQIRHYYNASGQAAAAIADIDAFGGCATPPPPGAQAPRLAAIAAAAPAGEATLDLLGGRFEATVGWTDFAGRQGDGLTAPLRSGNSGLFYFFSPENWEMLVKLLDGCAINGHYWVLAAATTDVGYELRVRDTTTDQLETYRNPVGVASPAQIDIEAFACP